MEERYHPSGSSGIDKASNICHINSLDDVKIPVRQKFLNELSISNQKSYCLNVRPGPKSGLNMNKKNIAWASQLSKFLQYVAIAC